MLTLPDKCMSLLGESPWGPNCYNAVLLALGETKRQEFTSPERMTKWLEENCTTVESPQPGDIVVFFDPHKEDGYWLQHTALFLGGDRYWQKNGCGGWYSICPLHAVEEDYGHYQTAYVRRKQQ